VRRRAITPPSDRLRRPSGVVAQPDLGQASAVLELQEVSVRFEGRRGLSNVFGAAAPATVGVDRISLAVNRGELFALVGESGCGKTTTALVCLGLLKPDQGRVWLQGQEMYSVSRRKLRPLRKRIGVVFQDPYSSLDARFQVRDIVGEPLLIHERRLARHERDRRIEAALAAVRLAPPELYLERYVHELSGGQRQRVALAASLVLRPDVIVADEPVSMLDLSIRVGILQTLRDLADQGVGILMVTHDFSTVVHVADRIAVMYRGRVVESGSADAVFRRPTHPYSQALIEIVPGRRRDGGSRAQVLQGEVQKRHADRHEGCPFYSRCPHRTDECLATAPELAAVDDPADRSHRAACLLVGRSPASS
jgi:oligopeptide/dipeptide ABC transporter ATP-binding protein